jgi:uracil-DNA glycosylase
VTTWRDILKPTLVSKEYQSDIAPILELDTTTPHSSNLYKSLQLTTFKDTKVVILGNEPSCLGQSNGLAFGVLSGSYRPKELRSIIHEVEVQTLSSIPKWECTLEGWARQGVLLLNANLTVGKESPGSHRNIGWNMITNKVISALEGKGNVIFMLWGDLAKEKKKLLGYNSHVLESDYPGGADFMRNGHFIQANRLLIDQNKTTIDWTKVD